MADFVSVGPVIPLIEPEIAPTLRRDSTPAVGVWVCVTSSG